MVLIFFFTLLGQCYTDEPGVELVSEWDFLLKQGVNSNSINYRGETLLGFSIKYGNFYSAKLLLEHGADPMQQSKDMTPMQMASESGKAAIVQLLIECNVPVRDANISLACAARKGNSKVCTWLLLHGASPDFTEEGYRPLCLAVKNGRFETAKVLLEHKANVDGVRGGNLTTPLWWASYGRNFGMARMLLDHNADLFGVRSYGSTTPLEVAAYNGCYSMEKLLILHGGGIRYNDLETQNCSKTFEEHYKRWARKRKKKISEESKREFNQEVQMKLVLTKQMYLDHLMCLANLKGVEDSLLSVDEANTIVDYAIGVRDHNSALLASLALLVDEEPMAFE